MCVLRLLYATFTLIFACCFYLWLSRISVWIWGCLHFVRRIFHVGSVRCHFERILEANMLTVFLVQSCYWNTFLGKMLIALLFNYFLETIGRKETNCFFYSSVFLGMMFKKRYVDYFVYFDSCHLLLIFLRVILKQWWRGWDFWKWQTHVTCVFLKIHLHTTCFSMNCATECFKIIFI